MHIYAIFMHIGIDFFEKYNEHLRMFFFCCTFAAILGEELLTAIAVDTYIIIPTYRFR